MMETQKMSKRGMVLILLTLLVLVGAACMTGNTTSSQEEDNANVILSDDFSDSNSGWEVGDYPGGTVGYGDGVYEVVSFGDSKVMWGISKEQYSNVVIEVEATQVEAPSSNNNDYGVMCRVQENGDGYSLLVSGDGYYAIQVSVDGNFTALVDWTESGKIEKGNATNEIKAICDGENLTLYVNGSKLAEATDSTFSEGFVSMAATSYESSSTTINFDNLVLREP
jgi:hypothetical protein